MARGAGGPIKILRIMAFMRLTDNRPLVLFLINLAYPISSYKFIWAYPLAKSAKHFKCLHIAVRAFVGGVGARGASRIACLIAVSSPVVKVSEVPVAAATGCLID